MPLVTQHENKMELYVEIKNDKPLELLDLTKSLVALGNQFNKYANEHGYPEVNRDTKLFVEKIESGSVLITLYELAKLIFIANSIFLNYHKLTVRYFTLYKANS